VVRGEVTSSHDDSGEFEAPSPELIEEALVRIGDLQHRRVFYDGLENPKWVKPLADANAFINVPATVVDAEGYLRTTPWPEGDYLVRMAALVPGEVAEVLGPLKETEDPYVQRVILRAATRMPADLAREFVPTVTRLIDGPLVRLMDPRDWVQLVSTLAHDEATAKDAMALANALYRPKAGPPEDGPWPRKRAVVGLEGYGYRRSMPTLREALAPFGLKTLTQLKIWLEEYQVHSGNYFEDRKRDVSTMWRPSIRRHEQNRGFDEVSEALVDAVRDEAISLLGRGFGLSDVLRVLLRSDHPLIQRIALHVVTEAVSETADGRVQGREHLFDRRYLDEDFRNEYAHLARAVLPTLSDEEKEQWLALVVSGPFQDLDWLEERAGRYLQEGETVEEVVQRYREVWRRDVLASIGSDHLPQSGSDLLAQLVEKWGAPEHPEFPNWMEFKEVTPRGAEEAAKLASMPVSEVVAWLREWTPEGGSSFEEPTIEGQARALESDVRQRPAEYVEVASEFARLDPTYVRALCSGLAETVKQQSATDWAPLIVLAESVVAHDEGPDQEVQGFDRDGSWRFAQRELLRLIEAALTKKGPDRDTDLPLSSLVEVVASLTESPDPTPEYEAQYGGDNMDPLTLSLNGVRPVAVAQLADILLHIHASEAEGRTAPEGLSSRIETVLESRMGAATDASLAVAAAFGRSFGKLIDADEAWARSALSRLIGEPGAPVDSAYTDIVVSTALATYRPSLKLVTFLADYYRSMLERAARGEAVAVGWHRERTATELLGDHLVVLLVRGELQSSDPLVSGYFANATVEDRASVLGHLGWGLGREDELPGEIIERARQLMDARVASVRAGSDVNELSGFEWWAMANHFAPEWWLPILELAATGDNLDPHGMVGEALEGAAEAAPGSALRVLKALLSRRTEPFQRFGLVDHAPGVITAALDSDDEEVVEDARALLDQLGRQGELRLGDLVEERRKKP
jgi:hypothetical protein